MVPRQHRSVATVDGQEPGMVEQSTIPTASFTRSALLRYAGVALVVGIPVLILVLFVLYPLAAIILQSIFPNLSALNPAITRSLGPLAQVLGNWLNYQAFGSSLWLSAITVLIRTAFTPILTWSPVR